jgi:aquaporin Z
LIASGKAGFDLAGGFASNGYAEHSPGGYSVGGWALEQLWFFWLAPIVGAALAGIVYPMIASE